MSDDRVERDLAELPDAGGPRAGWEGRVLATVRSDTARVAAMARPKRRQPLTFALAGGCAVALASMLFFALRPDPQAAEEKAAVEQLDRLVKDLEQAQIAAERAAKETEDKYQELLAARTDEEKAQAQAALDRLKRLQEARYEALRAARARAGQVGAGATKPARNEQTVTAKCEPNDPLCGI